MFAILAFGPKTHNIEMLAKYLDSVLSNVFIGWTRTHRYTARDTDGYMYKH